MRKPKSSPFHFYYTVDLDLAKPDYVLIKEFRAWLKRPDIKQLRASHERRQFFQLLPVVKNIAAISRQLRIPASTLRRWRNLEERRWD